MDECCLILTLMSDVLLFPSPHCPSQVQHTLLDSFSMFMVFEGQCELCACSHTNYMGGAIARDRTVALGVATSWEKELPVYLLRPS